MRTPLRRGQRSETRFDPQTARAADRTTVIHVETDPSVPSPDSQGWWDVPVAEVSALDSAREARAAYEVAVRAQHPPLRPAPRVD